MNLSFLHFFGCEVNEQKKICLACNYEGRQILQISSQKHPSFDRKHRCHGESKRHVHGPVYVSNTVRYRYEVP